MGRIVGRSTLLLALLAMTALLATTGSPPVVAQTAQTKQVMRQKLVQSEQLLAALVTSNWVALDRHSRALEAVTNEPGWDVMRLPEYHQHTTAFQRSIRALTRAAEERDQRTAVAAYNGLVASCVECHRYVARARIAQAQ
jgi:hypothetical protein